MTATLVHLTRIRPGRLAEVNRRLAGYTPEDSSLRATGVTRLQFFTTSELGADGVVVAVIEGADDAAILRFLDDNEQRDPAGIHRLYLPHDHKAVPDAPARFSHSLG